MLRTFVTIAEFGQLLVISAAVEEPGRCPTACPLVCKEDSTGISNPSYYILSDELVDILQRLPGPWQKLSSLYASPFLEQAHRRRPQMSFNLTGVPQCGVCAAQYFLQSVGRIDTDADTRSPASFLRFPRLAAL